MRSFSPLGPRTRVSIGFFVSDTDKYRALDAELVNALPKIFKGDFARLLAVTSDTLAKRDLVLGELHILFLIYREFEKNVKVTNVYFYSHLEKNA